MFLAQPTENLKPNKSNIQIKRQSLHSQRAQEQKDKIKKSTRFDNMVRMILQKDQSQYDYILHIQLQQVENILKELMNKDDSIALSHCISKLQDKYRFQQFLTYNFLRDFVQFSKQKISRPEIIFLYFSFAQYQDFRNAVFEKKEIVENIVKEIRSLKEGIAQQIYLDVLEQLTPSYLKRHEEKAGQIFDIFSQKIENRTIDFGKVLKILKTISPYISQERSFRFSTVQHIAQIYEEESHKQKSNLSLMIDCFLVLTKIIFYQEDIDIVTNLRLMKIVLNAKMNLPSKIIEQYYDAYSLLAKLVEKTGVFQVQKISRVQIKTTINKLITKYPKISLCVPISQNYLTSIVLNYLFQENNNLLDVKEFSIGYMKFFLEVCTYCSPEVILDHFKKAEFFQFLGQAIDHGNVQINFLALEIIFAMISSETNSSEVYIFFKEYSQIQTVLTEKLHKKINQQISEKILLILEIFHQFDKH